MRESQVQGVRREHRTGEERKTARRSELSRQGMEGEDPHEAERQCREPQGREAEAAREAEQRAPVDLREEVRARAAVKLKVTRGEEVEDTAPVREVVVEREVAARIDEHRHGDP